MPGAHHAATGTGKNSCTPDLLCDAAHAAYSGALLLSTVSTTVDNSARGWCCSTRANSATTNPMQSYISHQPCCCLQEQLPKSSAQAVAQAAQLLRLRTRAPVPARLWRPSRQLCALLNDLREVSVFSDQHFTT